LFSTESVDASPVFEPGIQVSQDTYQPILNVPPLTILRI
jgi:hypothetical protein